MKRTNHPLRDWIRTSGMTNKEFAREVGISPVQLSRVLNGKSHFSQETAERVSQLTTISSDVLQKINIVNIKKLTSDINSCQVISDHRSLEGNRIIPFNPLLTVKQIACYLNKHVNTVYKMVRSGDIPATRVGGEIRFKKAEIDQWLSERGNGNGNHS